MDSKAFRSLATKLRRVADKDVSLRPTSFSKQLDRAFAIAEPLKRQEQIYVATIGYAMSLATELANSGFAKQLLKRLESGIDEYMPGYPPISPVTDSHFYCSTYMSYRFGVEHETAAEIIQKVFQEWNIDPRGIESLKRLCCSRSGILETKSVSPDRILVRELVTDREFFLYCSAGYRGRPGELRFSRVAIPAEANGDTFYELTTPYILTGVDAGEWAAYLRSDMPELATRRDPLCGPDPERELLPRSDIADRLAALFEEDCGVMHWNDFIMDGYSNYEKSAIFLAGIPNRPETLPHNDAFEETATARSGWKHVSTPRGDFDFSPDLIDEDGEFDQDEVDAYFETLQEQFEESSECASLSDQDHSYLSLLLSFGLDYFRALPTTLLEGELREILFDLIPRKVTMEADEAAPLVREFRAFFRFLHREFSVTSAARLATICDESAARKLKSKLSDSSSFGLAKSFFSAGRAAGFDMTSEDDIAAFTSAYNQQMTQQHDAIDDEASTLIREKPTVGRNEPCPCGSGKKFKKCCLKS